MWPLHLGNSDLRIYTTMDVQPARPGPAFRCQNCCVVKSSHHIVFRDVLKAAWLGLWLCTACNQEAADDLTRVGPSSLGHHLAALAKRSLLTRTAADLETAQQAGAAATGECGACRVVSPTWGCTTTLEDFACTDSGGWRGYCAPCFLATTARFHTTLMCRETALLSPGATLLALSPLPHDVVLVIWQMMGRLIDLWEVLYRDVEAADASR